jgi:cell division protease FtsH
MSKKLRSLIRAVVWCVPLAAAIYGRFGLGVQVVAIVVVMTAFREDLAGFLRALFEDRGERLEQSESGKSLTAFHEAGHAVVGWVLPGGTKPQSVTIRQTDTSNGHVISAIRTSDSWSIDDAIDQLALWFAGAAAECEFGHGQSTGWQEDLVEATSLAKKMVCEWGFSGKLKSRYYDTDSGMLTEEILEIINAEIDRFLELGERLAAKTVKEHRDTIGRVAGLLLQHETLNQAKLKAAIENAP